MAFRRPKRDGRLSRFAVVDYAGCMETAGTDSTGVRTLRIRDSFKHEQLHNTAKALLDDLAARCLLIAAEPGASTRESQGGSIWMITFALPIVVATSLAADEGTSEVALAADIRVCSPDASFVIPEKPGPVLQSRLETLIGHDPKLPGRRLEASELLDRGLVSAVAEYPRAEAERIASAIAARGPIATQLGKEALWRGLELPLEQGLRIETDLTLVLQTTKDRAEGVAAFLENRPPQFTGD